MNKSTQIIVAVLAVIVVAGGIITSVVLKKNDETTISSKSDTVKSIEKNEAVNTKLTNETPAITPTNIETKVSSDTVTQIEGKYVDYKSELLANADQGPVVLFFHANWCPTCRALDKDVNDQAEQFKKTGITLLKIDYDTAKDLKKQYNITSQSSFVKVDRNGKELKKASALVTVDSLSAFANN